MVRRLIADEDVAEEYKKLKHSEPSIGLAFSNTALASSSVVKLSFQKNTTSKSILLGSWLSNRNQKRNSLLAVLHRLSKIREWFLHTYPRRLKGCRVDGGP